MCLLGNSQKSVYSTSLGNGTPLEALDLKCSNHSKHSSIHPHLLCSPRQHGKPLLDPRQFSLSPIGYRLHLLPENNLTSTPTGIHSRILVPPLARTIKGNVVVSLRLPTIQLCLSTVSRRAGIWVMQLACLFACLITCLDIQGC